MSKLFADLMDKKLAPSPPSAASPSLEDESTSEVESPISNESSDSSMEQTPRSVPEREKSQLPANLASKPKRVQGARNTQPSTILTNQENNIAILQLSKADIDELRTTAYKNQTFRFSEDELNWLRDRSYGLTRALNRKVGQNDLLRLALKIFRKTVADKQEVLEEVLDPII